MFLLLDQNQRTSAMGASPFASTSSIKLYNPAGADSQAVYKTIGDNLAGWVDEAIRNRG